MPHTAVHEAPAEASTQICLRLVTVVVADVALEIVALVLVRVMAAVVVRVVAVPVVPVALPVPVVLFVVTLV
jgi:hypothetical protein